MSVSKYFPEFSLLLMLHRVMKLLQFGLKIRVFIAIDLCIKSE